MASTWDNFKLGSAGAADAWVYASTFGQYNPGFAAEVYTSQTVGSTGSQKERDQVYAAAMNAEQNAGVLGSAASATADEVADKVADAFTWGKWVVAGAAVVGVAILAWRVAR